MHTFWHRIKAFSDQSLAWLFIWMSALYQVGFAIPYEAMHQSVLYTTLHGIHNDLPEVWAVLGVIATVILLVGIATNKRLPVRIASYMQVTVWVFAFIIYAIHGVALLSLAIAATQVLFWAWNLAYRELEKKSKKIEQLLM